MAKRVANKRVLEWVSEALLLAAGGGDARAVINLNLDDDEVAEIRMIETEVAVQTAELGADDEIDAQCMLSMDPSVVIAEPYGEATYEDLETFHSHRENFVSNITTSGMAAIFTNRKKQVTFPENYPLLLATNPSFVAIDDAGINLDYHCRIWFTRRKSVGNELARTLLKRR